MHLLCGFCSLQYLENGRMWIFTHYSIGIIEKHYPKVAHSNNASSINRKPNHFSTLKSRKVKKKLWEEVVGGLRFISHTWPCLTS